MFHNLHSDYEENAAKQKAKRDMENQRKSEADLARSQEEKRKLHKQIIDKIPIEKIDLFNHPLDRAEIDGNIKKKVQSWINKKIIEYIGEPEPTLVDFICSKLIAGSTPQSILDDVKMVSRNDSKPLLSFKTCLQFLFRSSTKKPTYSLSKCGDCWSSKSKLKSSASNKLPAPQSKQTHHQKTVTSLQTTILFQTLKEATAGHWNLKSVKANFSLGKYS